MLKRLFVLEFFTLCFNLQSQTQLRVLSQADSTSIPFALVALEPGHIHLLSDELGNLTIPAIMEGSVRCMVRKIGFVNWSYQGILADMPTTLYLKTDPNQLNEIVVYGQQSSLQSETANSIDVLSSKSMREQGALNLSDGIAKLPGVSQLSTGAGISKPVIRGLFGNRIQTVLLGMRFDNQQWQDEHGLGLSDIGIDRIEVIKGPASLFYGSEAMGGVLNIINEKEAPPGKTQVDVGGRFFSNTNGYCFDAGVKNNTKKFYYGIRAGYESHGDYSDGNNKRILNSRFGGQNIKASLGWQKKNWQSENTYLFGLNHFGFLMDAYQLYDKADDRWSRSFERPHHTVLMNLVSSTNTLTLKSSKLNINAGYHYNNRQEQEGAGGISLDMVLNTAALSVVWNKALTPKLDLSLGTQNQFQSNRNQGSRIIVPDANLAEGSAFVYVRRQSRFAVWEGGVRYDAKNIQTLASGKLNMGDPSIPGGASIVPVNRFYNTVNGSLGLSLFDAKHWQWKANFSSGYRGPNLAELSSNGLHEGSVRYEIGNVNLKIEQNFCGSTYLSYRHKQFTVYVDAYANRFKNYIYLQGSDNDYYGMRIYYYLQRNALIGGVESAFTWHPQVLKQWQWQVSYNRLSGQTLFKENLPFIPAPKLNNEWRYKLPSFKGFRHLYVSFSYVYVYAQNNVSQFETASPAYHLLNASLGGEHKLGKNTLVLSVALNNLSNETYFDHLSRFKYYGINNMGRNMNINLRYQFN